MKKVLTVLALFSYFFFEAKAQGLTFRATYPNVTITSACQTSDLGYIIAGYSTAYGIGAKDIVMIKTDSIGTVQWSVTYGNSANAGAEDISANAVEIPGDDGYYLTGQLWNQGNNTYEIYVLRTDADGTELWSKTMYNGGYDKGMHVENAAGGGCIVTGWVGNSSKGYLCRLNAIGNIQWQTSIAYLSGAWVLQSCRETATGDIIAAGYDNEQGAYEMWLVKTDSSGAIIWQRSYAMAATYNFAYDVCATYDNGCLLAGGSSGINLAKIDMLGNIQWAMTYIGADPRAYSVQQCADSGYIVLANDLNNNQYLMKTDASGNVQWTKLYTTDYNINTIEQTADGGYVFATGSDLIKTDSNGYTGCGETSFTFTADSLTLIPRIPVAYTTSQVQNFAAVDSSTSPVILPTSCFPTSVNTPNPGYSSYIYPNPSHSTFTIYLDNQSAIGSQLKIFDIAGRLVHQQIISSANQQINSDFSPGVYFVRVTDVEKMFTEKLVIE
jgi:hypothetical protein